MKYITNVNIIFDIMVVIYYLYLLLIGYDFVFINIVFVSSFFIFNIALLIINGHFKNYIS